MSKVGIDPLIALCVLGLAIAVGRFRGFPLPLLVGLISDDSLLLDSPVDVAVPGAAPPDKGLGGKLVVLTPPRGGWGNALILIVFLILLPAALTPGEVGTFGRPGLLNA